MRIFIAVLILIFSFQSWTKAEDISEFEIEGISIGDSLLDHVSKNFIEQRIEAGFIYPNSKKFSIIPISVDNSEMYSDLNIGIKPSDSKYIIHTINAFVSKNLEECLIMKKKIVKEIFSMIPNIKSNSYEDNYLGNFGNSKAYVDHFYLENGMIRTWCDVWDKNLDQNWKNSLNVASGSSEWDDFLKHEAYK